jgi:hypothetical protein
MPHWLATVRLSLRQGVRRCVALSLKAADKIVAQSSHQVAGTGDSGWRTLNRWMCRVVGHSSLARSNSESVLGYTAEAVAAVKGRSWTLRRRSEGYTADGLNIQLRLPWRLVPPGRHPQLQMLSWPPFF